MWFSEPPGTTPSEWAGRNVYFALPFLLGLLGLAFSQGPLALEKVVRAGPLLEVRPELQPLVPLEHVVRHMRPPVGVAPGVRNPGC